MKHLTILFALMVMTTLVWAQGTIQQDAEMKRWVETVYEADSTPRWQWEIGLNYGRFMSINSPSYSGNLNLGGNIGLRRNFGHRSVARLRADYNMIQYYRGGNDTHTAFAGLNLEYLVYLTSHHKVVRPYPIVGFGTVLYNPHVGGFDEIVSLKHYDLGFQINTGVGLDFKLNKRVNLKTEFIYHTFSNSQIENNAERIQSKGLFNTNGDTYAQFQVGLVFRIGHKRNEWTIRHEKVHYAQHRINFRHELESLNKVEPKVVAIPNQMPLDEFYVIFDFDSDKLTYQTLPVLDLLVKKLDEASFNKLIIKGTTDKIGNVEYNVELSQRRAQTVREYLIEKGLNSDKLITRGLGVSRDYNNENDLGRAWNRSVRFEIIW